MLDLPYIYSQVESNEHYYAYGECGTHTSTYQPSGTVPRPGKRGCFEYVRFFNTPGILPLPYQFYHHAHKMLCDHDHSENFFLFDAGPVKCNVTHIITLGTTLTVPCAVLY